MKIENTEARVHHVGNEITLLPGVNDNVDEKAWDKVKDLPVVKHHVKVGHFVIIDEKAKR